MITPVDLTAMNVIGYNLAVPEPSTFTLLGASLLGLAALRLQRDRSYWGFLSAARSV